MTSVLERMIQRARGPLSAVEPLSPPAFGPRAELWTSPGGIETVASEPAAAHRPAADRPRAAERSSGRPSGDPSPGEDPPIGVHAGTVAMAPPEPAVMRDAPAPATTPDIDAPSHSQPPAVRGETGASGPSSPGDDRHEAPPRAVIEPASRIPAEMPDPDAAPSAPPTVTVTARQAAPAAPAGARDEPAGPELAADDPAATTRDGSDRTPGTGAHQTPGSGAHQTPGSGAHQTPGSGAHQTPGDGCSGPDVTISIGHIEVHAAPAIERPRAQPPFRPRVSLEEFLGQKQERRR